ncbi:MAG: TetR/AcrR family transcriptional regulator [Lachnospiraceae bacterium]|nr:TetR/AcrR family transcriptional regulator [Lachnospiraceae bacterium]
MALDRREFNRQETQRQIRDTFLEMYRQRGIDGITVSDICKEAQVSKSTFYMYFEDKYSVLETIENYLLEQLAKINESVSDSSILHGLNNKEFREGRMTADFIKEHMEEFRAIMGPKGDPSFETRWRQHIMEKYREAFRKQRKDDSNAGVACTIFTSVLIGVYRHFIFENPDIPREEISAIISDVLTYTMRTFHT